MGLRFRKSVSLGKGLRLNFGKKGVSLSAGVPGAHVTYSTTGRKTTSVGIPGTGVSYVKSEKIGGKKSGSSDAPTVPTEGDNLLGSNPPPKKKRGCAPFAVGAVVLVVIIALFQQCAGGNNSASSAQTSSASSIQFTVSSTVSSEIESSSIFSSEASSAPKSKATSSAVPASSVSVSSSVPAAAKSTIALTGAPGTVSSGSNATLSIKGKPNTEYSISVYYSNGASTAQGLKPKTSGSDGTVSWTWKVGAKTTAGTHRIVVEGGGDQLETSITTTK